MIRYRSKTNLKSNLNTKVKTNLKDWFSTGTIPLAFLGLSHTQIYTPEPASQMTFKYPDTHVHLKKSF